jgi:hypothetical protein
LAEDDGVAATAADGCDEFPADDEDDDEDDGVVVDVDPVFTARLAAWAVAPR